MKSEEFDKQVRSLLEDREMSPSPAAWERLEAQMDSEPGKPSGSLRFWWVAASIAGLVLILTGIHYNTGGDPQPLPLVEQQVHSQQVSEPEQVADEVFMKVTPVPVPAKTPVIQMAVRQVAPEKVQGENAQEHTALKDREEIAVVSVHFKPVKTTEYMAASDAAAKEMSYEQEADALLAKARRDLELQASENIRRVNANALLADVEEELDRNFKDKALEAIKKGVVRLRSAVADGN